MLKPSPVGRSACSTPAESQVPCAPALRMGFEPYLVHVAPSGEVAIPICGLEGFDPKPEYQSQKVVPLKYTDGE